MIAPTDRKLVNSKAMPMTSPAIERLCHKKSMTMGTNQHAPVRSPELKVIFRSMSFLLHRNENTMDMMPKTARLSVKRL
jgi:hypothetical protein